MARTYLSKQRLVETKKLNIGNVIIFCEGETEKNYLDYFSGILKESKYTSIKVILETASGNAKRVLNYANEFLRKEENAQKFSMYEKYLMFDCDAPKNIQEVILEASGFRLLISNYFFEVWLLMHFENVDSKFSRKKIYQKLSYHLNKEYKKGDKGIVREIVQNGSIEKAIDYAKALEKTYEHDKLSIMRDIKQMNPYSNVYQLIEQFMLEIS